MTGGEERRPTVGLSLMDRLDSVDGVGRPEHVVPGFDFGDGEHAVVQPQMGVDGVVEFLTCKATKQFLECVSRRLLLRGSKRRGEREGRRGGGTNRYQVQTQENSCSRGLPSSSPRRGTFCGRRGSIWVRRTV